MGLSRDIFHQEERRSEHTIHETVIAFVSVVHYMARYNYI